MSNRDKYGNYVNDKGVTIKITTDKNGNDHVSFYKGKVDKPHEAAHVNVNYDKKHGVLQHMEEIKVIQVQDQEVVI